MGENLPHDRRQRGPRQIAFSHPTAACRIRRIQQFGVTQDLGTEDCQFQVEMREGVADGAWELLPM